MRSHALMATACLLVCSTALAQPQWQRTYGGSAPDAAKSMQPTADGGYIVAGGTFSFGAGSGDVWLIKTDSLGDTAWTRTFGGSELDFGSSVQPTEDGGYVIAGYTESFGAGDGDIWLIKTDSDGDTLWARTYGGVGWEDCGSVRQTSDLGYLVIGSTESYGSGGTDVWLIRTDSLGDTLWTRTYGGTTLDEGYDVLLTSDGGCLVTAFTLSFGAGSGDAWLLKTDSLGDTLWTRTCGGSGTEYVYSAAMTTGRGYVITGSTESYGGGGLDVWLVRVNGSGDTLWTRAFGGTETDEGRSVRQTGDGGYVIAASTESFGAGSSDVWLIRTDGSGDTLWTCTCGDTGLDEPYAVLQTLDLGFIVAGTTTSTGAGSYDAWLIKIGPEGPVAVADNRLPMEATTTGPTILRGVLRLPSSLLSLDYSLLSSDGRMVCRLRPGDNDIRTLSPGVYYLTTHPRGLAARNQVRRIVVTK